MLFMCPVLPVTFHWYHKLSAIFVLWVRLVWVDNAVAARRIILVVHAVLCLTLSVSKHQSGSCRMVLLLLALVSSRVHLVLSIGIHTGGTFTDSLIKHYCCCWRTMAIYALSKIWLKKTHVVQSMKNKSSRSSSSSSLIISSSTSSSSSSSSSSSFKKRAMSFEIYQQWS